MPFSQFLCVCSGCSFGAIVMIAGCGWTHVQAGGRTKIKKKFINRYKADRILSLI